MYSSDCSPWYVKWRIFWVALCTRALKGRKELRKKKKEEWDRQHIFSSTLHIFYDLALVRKKCFKKYISCSATKQINIQINKVNSTTVIPALEVNNTPSYNTPSFSQEVLF
jgi:hypothetical protein